MRVLSWVAIPLLAAIVVSIVWLAMNADDTPSGQQHYPVQLVPHD
jgi:hypothetical protein